MSDSQSNEISVVDKLVSCVYYVRVEFGQVRIFVETDSSDTVDYRMLYFGVLRNLPYRCHSQSDFTKASFRQVPCLFQIFHDQIFFLLVHQVFPYSFGKSFYIFAVCVLLRFTLHFLCLQFVIKVVFLYFQKCTFQFLNLILIIILCTGQIR